jgi:hypothetical protein
MQRTVGKYCGDAEAGERGRLIALIADAVVVKC